MDITVKLAEEFGLTARNAENCITLLDEGNTVPFIARYRKEQTGNIDDQVLREFSERLIYLRNLEKRKEEVSAAIEGQGKLTEEITVALSQAVTLAEVEDIYRPYKQKKKTRASVAIAKGLEPLADLILQQTAAKGDLTALATPYVDAEKGVENEKDALSGASDIIAERVSDNAELRKRLRTLFLKFGVLSTKAVKTDKEGGEVYETYADYQEPVSEIKSYRTLAVNRGEDEGFLRVKVEIDADFAHRIARKTVVKAGAFTEAFLSSAADDGYDRLIAPSIEREIRSELTDRAEEQAIKVFEMNLKNLLMRPALKGKIIMGFDPGFRTGCKIAVVDPTGKFLDKTVVYPTQSSDKKKEEAKAILSAMIKKWKVDVISIGNGTASRESEQFISEMIQTENLSVAYIVENEAGASVYSASKIGKEEFPDFDVSERSAVSIARRVQDPLSELIKIDPKFIGVGQYQHDMPEKRLDSALSGVLEDCVNAVGVNLNTASYSLLTYVAGLNSAIAKNIVEYREQNGVFTRRNQVLKVPKLGEKAYKQCAGFLRVADGENVLDNTGVHPESYPAAEQLLKTFSYTLADVKNGAIGELKGKVSAYGVEKAATECGVGVPTLNDIVAELMKPGRDVRDKLEQPLLRTGAMDLSELKVGTVLKGTVRNVTDFGAFVDIGVHQDGLVHISELSDRFIRHPSEVVKVGDQVTVSVLTVDVKKQRIGLTMKGVQQSVKKQNA